MLGLAFVMLTLVQVASGQPCVAKRDSFPLWRPPAGAAHGTQEFDHSVRIALPREITSVVIELWGGGGGGGRGSAETYSEAGSGGGGGASGSYIRANFVVVPGTEYALIAGPGGAGAINSAGRTQLKGQDGGDSAVCANDDAAFVATGGRGGDSAQGSGRGGAGGKGLSATFSGGSVSAVQRRGNDGRNGLLPLFEIGGSGGKGGAFVSGTVEPKGSFGGSGGTGEMRPDPAGDGNPGGSGSIIISW